MFCSPQLAARIDRAEGRMCEGIASAVAAADPSARTAVFELGGGMAIFAGPGSPTNKVIGAGYDGLPNAAELDLIEEAWAARQAPLQAEVSTLADPEFHALLIQRGYEPRGFESLLGHPLTTLSGPVPPDIVVERYTEPEMPAWIETAVEAWAHPDVGGVGGDVIPPADELRRWMTLTMQVPGFQGFVARVDNRVAGGGALRYDGDIAQFCGAWTLPRFRRRGVQTALVRWRLADARASGCTVAVVATQPASKSQQNVQREGFALLYARQLLVKPA
jgi:hypothetical protein